MVVMPADRPTDRPVARPDDSPATLETLAIELAQGAAQVVRDAGAAGRVAAKSTATDLVTDVDARAERWLVEQLARQRPGDAVLGEEGGGHGGATRVRWILDPIDGTVNFVLGLPQYAVSVAVEVDGVVVAGAVSNVATGETFHAHAGGGAWCDGQRLHGPREVPLERAVIGTGFGYDAAVRARQVAAVAELLPRVADVRRLGAASLDLCFVAAGRLDGYFESGLNEWDYAAGLLVALEAGCAATGPDAAEPSTRFVAVAGVSFAEDLFALLRRVGAEDALG